MKDKIEEILRKYIRADVEDKVGCAEFLNRELVKELSTLIQEERKDAVEGFADWLEKQQLEFREVNFGYRPSKVLEKAQEYLQSLESEK